MKLYFHYSKKNKCFALVNTDGVDSEKQTNRRLDCWRNENAIDINITYWWNDQVTESNPHLYNRVGVHYTVDGRRYRKYYFCIQNIIQHEELTFETKFSENE